MATDLMADEDREVDSLPIQLPDRYEIIDGQVVELHEMGTKSTVLGTRLAFRLTQFGYAHDLGEAHPDTLFRLPLPVDRNRRPDVAFVPFSRWPRNRQLPTTNAWDVLPQLAVEVVSPNDFAEDQMEKILEYFDAGVSMVWVIYPLQAVVHVFENWTTIRVLTRDQELTGDPILPGFRLPLAELFLADEPPPQPS